MRIRSKFKDYYDFVGHRYGQDPDILYDRKPLVGEQSNSASEPAICFEVDTDSALFGTGSNSAYRFEFVVAGTMRVFPIIYELGDTWGKVTRRITVEEYFEQHKEQRELSPHWDAGAAWMLDPRCTFSEKAIVDCIRAVGQPVFRVLGTRWVGGDSGTWRRSGLLVAKNIPILREGGVANAVPPEQMWQNIYSTIQNVLRANPDKEVPVTLENKDRIQKAGFDLKTSFRGKPPK